jgi:signal transduction histidine kinase
MNSSTEPQLDSLAEALGLGQFGVALIDAAAGCEAPPRRAQRLAAARGRARLRPPLLLGMEDSLRTLQARGGDITLPSMRLPAEDARRITISIAWSADSDGFVVITTRDHGGDQIDRLLAGERREKQLLQQQAAAAAAKARVAASFYRDIVESSGDLVLRFGPDLKIVFANERAARFLCAPLDQLRARPIGEVFPGLGQTDPWRIDMCADGPASFELAARSPSGALVWLGWDVRFIGDAGGEFQAVGRDVTQARRLRAEIDKANEEARAAAIGAERLRIAHDLHDTLVRSIVTLIAQTRLIARGALDAATKGALAELEQEAREGLREAREALTQMRAARREEDDPRRIVEAFARRSPKDRSVDIHADLAADIGDPPPETAEALGRILRETLRNIELHSGARRVLVELRRDANALRLDIVDDGVGFDPSAPAPGHYGLIGMKERAASIGASLDIASAPGRGTRVTLRAPIERP